MPVGGATFAEALRMAAEVFQTLKKVLSFQEVWPPAWATKAASPRTCPPTRRPWTSSWTPSSRPATGPGWTWSWPWTPAASEFFDKATGEYVFKKGDGSRRYAAAMTDYYRDLAARYPIVSIEDGLAEDDWDGWVHLTQELGCQAATGGRRYLRHQRAILAERHPIGRGQRHSHQAEPDRHGHRDPGRPSTWPGATATGPSSPTAPGRRRTPSSPTWRWPPGPGRSRPARLSRSERIAKYNRLLLIEAELGPAARFREDRFWQK